MRETIVSGIQIMLRRRQIAAILVAGHAAPALAALAAPDAFVLEANGWVPNNPMLPVLHYHGLTAGRPPELETMFGANGWPAVAKRCL